MNKTPVREGVRVSINTENRTNHSKIVEKNVKQVLQEATQIRRRSAELSERIKQFLTPMTLENWTGGSGVSPVTTQGRPISRPVLLPLQEDDVIEIINDVQDESQNVMDVRVPRLEALVKLSGMSERPLDEADKRLIGSSQIPTNSQEAGREYKILKQLLKDTEESNRRSKELVMMMERTLLTASPDSMVKMPKKVKPKRVSDVSKSDKIKPERNERMDKRGSNVSKSAQNEEKRRGSKSKRTSDSKSKAQVRPKTEMGPNLGEKTKKSSKVKNISSTSALKPVSSVPKTKKKSVRVSVQDKKVSDSQYDVHTPNAYTPEPSEHTPITDISDMIDAIGRRDTNIDAMKQYFSHLGQAVHV